MIIVKMRLDNGAAVVRFKFGGQEAFQPVRNCWMMAWYRMWHSII